MEYRELGPGELIQKGDEPCVSHGCPWSPCIYTIGKFVGSRLPDGCGNGRRFRRPIEYRILDKYEIIKDGDEYSHKDFSNEWEPATSSVGTTNNYPDYK